MSVPVVTRPGHTVVAALNQHASETTYWEDDVTTYVVSFSTDRGTWRFVREADIVVAAIEALRSGRTIDRVAFGLWLDTALKLSHRVTAVVDELLVYAREEEGDRPWSWRDIAGNVELHHTTLHERYGAALRRAGSPWRQWLLQDGPRAELIPEPRPPFVSHMNVTSDADAEVVLRANNAKVIERQPAGDNGIAHIVARAGDGRGLVIAIRPDDVRP